LTFSQTHASLPPALLPVWLSVCWALFTSSSPRKRGPITTVFVIGRDVSASDLNRNDCVYGSPPSRGRHDDHASGAEEREPDHAENQDREARRDGQQREHRRSGLGLARLGRGFDDLPVLFGCHGALDSQEFRMPCGTVHPKQRVMGADVPGFCGLRYPVAASLSPAGPSQDPIVEHAATLPRQRHAVKSKFLGFYR